VAFYAASSDRIMPWDKAAERELVASVWRAIPHPDGGRRR
jgi:hypothetical protein